MISFPLVGESGSDKSVNFICFSSCIRLDSSLRVRMISFKKSAYVDATVSYLFVCWFRAHLLKCSAANGIHYSDRKKVYGGSVILRTRAFERYRMCKESRKLVKNSDSEKMPCGNRHYNLREVLSELFTSYGSGCHISLDIFGMRYATRNVPKCLNFPQMVHHN